MHVFFFFTVIFRIFRSNPIFEPTGTPVGIINMANFFESVDDNTLNSPAQEEQKNF